jgi:hypothetical protein
MDTGTQIASGDLATPRESKPGGHQRICKWRSRTAAPDPQISAGDLVTVTEGAIATVTGAADIFLPHATTIVAPGHRGMALKPNTTLTVPSGPNVMAAGMGSVLSAAVLTTFGIGAEIGLVAVLAAHYSMAGHAGRVAAVVISAVVAAGLIIYGATGIRSLADPTPGTSLSSGAGTSFTLLERVQLTSLALAARGGLLPAPIARQSEWAADRGRSYCTECAHRLPG